MIATQAFNPQTIGISISESPDMASFGLIDAHLNDAMVNIATHLLAAGDNLAYGGDLREDGFTRTLFELVRRYTRRTIDDYQGSPFATIGNEQARVTNYLAWPVHASMSSAYLEASIAKVRDFANTVLLDLNGFPTTMEGSNPPDPAGVDGKDWTTGLTSMRETMRTRINARVLLGGRTEGYKGRMPGIAEEALLSLEAKQPIFLLGSFGGAARDVAEALQLAPIWHGSRDQWAGRSEFADFGPESLHNTLSHEENQVLATTLYIDRSLPLLLRGLRRLRNGPNNTECT